MTQQDHDWTHQTAAVKIFKKIPEVKSSQIVGSKTSEIMESWSDHDVIWNVIEAIYRQTHFQTKHSDNFRLKFIKFLNSKKVDFYLGWSRSEISQDISNGWNKLRTHTVYYLELFKLPRKRSQWKHLRITLKVICFMLTFCLRWSSVSEAEKIYSRQSMSWIDVSRFLPSFLSDWRASALLG